MIHYTPLCESDIYPTNEADYATRKCMTYEGKTVFADKNVNGEYQLVQLLSTDPQDYLDERFNPGTIIPQ
jgi:hypothetical protein